MAKIMSEGYFSHNDAFGTFAWAAPELLLENRCTERVDIYRCVHSLAAFQAVPTHRSMLVVECCLAHSRKALCLWRECIRPWTCICYRLSSAHTEKPLPAASLSGLHWHTLLI